MNSAPMTVKEQKSWIDDQCDKLVSKIKSSKFADLEKKDELLSLIESGVFLSAIFGELVEKRDKVKPDMEKQAAHLFREFRAIVEDMEGEKHE